MCTHTVLCQLLHHQSRTNSSLACNYIVDAAVKGYKVTFRLRFESRLTKLYVFLIFLAVRSKLTYDNIQESACSLSFNSFKTIAISPMKIDYQRSVSVDL